MAIINRVPELLDAKFGGSEKVVLQQVAHDTRLTYSTVTRWAKRRVDRADFPILEVWCRYFGVGVGEVLEFVPEESR